jgi:acetyl esterase
VTYETHKVWNKAKKGAHTFMTRDESIALLDPDLFAYLERPSEDLSAIPLSVARAQGDAAVIAMGGVVKRPPEVITVEGLFGAPRVEVRVHHPLQGKPKRAVLHVHGGGMVKGSAGAFDARTCDLANRLEAVVVAVAYRLAPETPFPGALHDCVAAWTWMISQVSDWGLTPASCILTGDSAGGGLAAAATLYLRDTGGVMPAGQVLVYPMLDYQTGLGVDRDQDQRLGWNSANNQFGWRALLGDQALPSGNALGHYSPSHAPSLRDLPPTWIGVGTIDLFLAENVVFASKLALAGCDVTLCTFKGAPHGFQAIPAKISRRFNRDYIAAFDRISS